MGGDVAVPVCREVKSFGALPLFVREVRMQGFQEFCRETKLAAPDVDLMRLQLQIRRRRSPEIRFSVWHGLVEGWQPSTRSPLLARCGGKNGHQENNETEKK